MAPAMNETSMSLLLERPAVGYTGAELVIGA